MDVEHAIVEETPVTAMPADSATLAVEEESAVSALDVEERWAPMAPAPSECEHPQGVAAGGAALRLRERRERPGPPVANSASTAAEAARPRGGLRGTGPRRAAPPRPTMPRRRAAGS